MIEKNNQFSTMGRPKKTLLARRQVRLWAVAVRVRAGVRSCRDLEKRLGDDGKWTGMWSRYQRGLVVPSGKRMGRIEMMVPGTIRYYEAGFWELLENRSYRWEDLDKAIATLPPWMFPELNRTTKFGKINKRNGIVITLRLAIRSIQNYSRGIYGLLVILVLMREAELTQDAEQYLMSLKAWAIACNNRVKHPVLRYLPREEFENVAKPIQYMEFSDPILNFHWIKYKNGYISSKYGGCMPRPSDFNCLDFIYGYSTAPYSYADVFEYLQSPRKDAFEEMARDLMLSKLGQLA